MGNNSTLTVWHLKPMVTFRSVLWVSPDEKNNHIVYSVLWYIFWSSGICRRYSEDDHCFKSWNFIIKFCVKYVHVSKIHINFTSILQNFYCWVFLIETSVIYSFVAKSLHIFVTAKRDDSEFILEITTYSRICLSILYHH